MHVANVTIYFPNRRKMVKTEQKNLSAVYVART